MKKNQYIQPQTEVVRLRLTQMITTSNTFEDDTYVDINSNTMEEGNGGDAASRHYNVWDDY